jgi:hypothetical protein
MAKSVAYSVLDAALSYIKYNANRLCVCSQQPTTIAMAVSTEMLAWLSIASTDLSLWAGSVNGRRIVVASAISFAVSVTGSAQHVCLAAASCTMSGLLLVTTCTSQVLTAGNTLTVPEWDYEIADPV